MVKKIKPQNNSTDPVTEETTKTSLYPENDLFKFYQDQFEEQQKQVLEFWTSVLNNCWWWTKK